MYFLRVLFIAPTTHLEEDELDPFKNSTVVSPDHTIRSLGHSIEIDLLLLALITSVYLYDVLYSVCVTSQPLKFPSTIFLEALLSKIIRRGPKWY
jgi:hypothetical protein